MTSPFPIANGSSFNNERIDRKHCSAALISTHRRAPALCHISALQSEEAKSTVCSIPNILISIDSNRCSQKTRSKGPTLREPNWQARHLAAISITPTHSYVYAERNISLYTQLWHELKQIPLKCLAWMDMCSWKTLILYKLYLPNFEGRWGSFKKMCPFYKVKQMSPYFLSTLSKQIWSWKSYFTCYQFNNVSPGSGGLKKNIYLKKSNILELFIYMCTCMFVYSHGQNFYE